MDTLTDKSTDELKELNKQCDLNADLSKKSKVRRITVETMIYVLFILPIAISDYTHFMYVSFFGHIFKKRWFSSVSHY